MVEISEKLAKLAFSGYVSFIIAYIEDTIIIANEKTISPFATALIFVNSAIFVIRVMGNKTNNAMKK
jgi:hypothetical protein